MNLIVIGRENSSSEVEEIRNRQCAVDLFPFEKLLDLLKLDVSPFLMADAIVCFIDVEGSEWESPHVRLGSQNGKLLIPDFVIKPIVAVKRDSSWQVLDLKKPGARLLVGPSRHARLSAEVTQAMAQLRDYGEYFKNPENKTTVSAALGHGLRFPELAVLIGRLHECEAEELAKAQSRDPDVRIVTYDEILERQRALVP